MSTFPLAPHPAHLAASPPAPTTLPLLPCPCHPAHPPPRWRDYCAHILIPLNKVNPNPNPNPNPHPNPNPNPNPNPHPHPNPQPNPNPNPNRNPHPHPHPHPDPEQCRIDHYYLPWTCTDLKHAYEKCQYDECAAPLLPHAP